MLSKRIIVRLDIKPPYLVKGIQMEGLRKIGNPQEYAIKYYKEGADELLFMDIDASLDGRSSLSSLISDSSQGTFIPVSAGGGIRSVDNIRSLLMAGADKVTINTGAMQDPSFITRASSVFGSQAIIVAIEHRSGLCYTDNGRERHDRRVQAWAREAVSMGAGELLITAIDHEGRRRGTDLETLRTICESVTVPVIAHGGIATPQHAEEAFKAGASAVCVASALHHNKTTIRELKQGIHDYPIRIA